MWINKKTHNKLLMQQPSGLLKVSGSVWLLIALRSALFIYFEHQSYRMRRKDEERILYLFVRCPRWL